MVRWLYSVWFLATLVQSEILIIMKFCTGIHGPQRMNPTDLGDSLTFHVAPPAGQQVYTYPVKYLNMQLTDWYKLLHRHS